MQHLTRNDFASALALLAALMQHGDEDDAAGFARKLVLALNACVASDLATFSVCDLQTGRRQVRDVPPVEDDAPLVGFLQLRNAVEQRRLARA